MLQKIINCPNLPTLPAVAVELLELTRDSDVLMADIAKLVMRDQGLASRVLRTVNSSFYGLPQPCATIDRALGLLGLKAIKALVLGFSMARVTKGVDETAFNLGDYWRRTICTAAAARKIASLMRTVDPDEAFTAGLFIDMGMLAAIVAVPDTYGPILASAPTEHSKLTEMEVAKLGHSHAEIGAAMAKKWRMPEPIVHTIRYHHTPAQADEEFAPLVNTVAFGQLAADTILAKDPAQPMANLMASAAHWFRRKNDDVEELLNNVSEAAMELGNILDQNIGELPDAQQILARANDQLVEQQIVAQRETQELEQKAQDLETQTVTDALTGAANRKHFDSEIVRLFNEARANQDPLAVLFIDADRFKSVNDTYGHKAGDAVLVELARRMMLLVGKLGTVCRYGGEEFAILIPSATADKAKKFADLLRKAIADEPFDLTEVDDTPDSLPITVSIGVSATDPSRPDDHTKPGQVVAEADKGVYAAKQNGRNRVELYHPRTNDTVRPASRELPAGPGSGRPNILLVEDDPIAAKCLREVLVAGDAQVTLVCNCADAVELIRLSENDAQAQPHIIICEHDLPDGTSGELIRAVKGCSWLGGVQVLVVTSSTNPNIPAAARAAGANGVYLKADIANDLDHWAQRVMQQAMTTAA